ncbi:MAG: Ig-like domain-containing protein, partial [Nanoarchaeota archaeon]
FNWTPTYDESGIYNVLFFVTDGKGGYDEQAIQITVLNVNRAPVLDSIGNKIINVSQTLTFIVSASDPDNDSVQLIANNLPVGAVFVAGVFNWTPGQDGNYQVEFIANDGFLNDSETITISVGLGNRPPTLQFMPNITVNETSLVIITAFASDPDNDSLLFSINDSRFVQVSNVFSWQTTYQDAGLHSISISVSDGQFTQSQAVGITVLNVNRAPILSQMADVAVRINETAIIQLNATDPDGDNLTFKLDANLPTPPILNSSSGLFKWLVPQNASGVYNISFTASDGSLNDTKSTQIRIIKTTAKLSASADSFIRTGAKNFNEGGNQKLYLQKSGGSYVFINFDINNSVRASITKAYLVLTITDSGKNWGAGELVTAQRVNQSWVEGNGWITGKNPSLRGIGSGITWSCAIDTDISNNKADCKPTWDGGVVALPSAPGVLHTNSIKGEVKWDVTQDIRDGASYGWMIKIKNESANGDVIYYSREGALAAGNLSKAPRLEIE